MNTFRNTRCKDGWWIRFFEVVCQFLDCLALLLLLLFLTITVLSQDCSSSQFNDLVVRWMMATSSSTGSSSTAAAIKTRKGSRNNNHNSMMQAGVAATAFDESVINFQESSDKRTKRQTRSTSKGLEAVSGLSFRMDNALEALNPPSPAAVMGASDPPVIIISALPHLM